MAGNGRETRDRLAVVIVNYNGRPHLDELFQSLKRQSFRNFQTILIDNASQDDSLHHIQHAFPWVRTLPQKENLGFSKAGNLGVRTSNAEYVVLLNTDLRLERDFLEELVAAADREPSIAAVASKILLYHRPGVLNGVGGCMNRLGYTWDRGMFEPDEGQYNEPCEVLFASAGAALFRRSAFLEAGGFDEGFFMYHEDVDLCWRFWLLGWRVVTAPKAVVHHHFGASTQASRSMLWRELMGERHNIRALIKNYEPAHLFRALVDLLLLPQPGRRKLQQLNNFLWNLGRLPDALRRRNLIQRRRVRSDRDLKDLIVESKHVPIRL